MYRVICFLFAPIIIANNANVGKQIYGNVKKEN
jgi:hypothetical protein